MIPHNRLRVIIIGGGASGTLVAAQLLRRAIPNLDLILIERHPVLGQGVAYRTTEPWHLLNVPAGAMSALPQDPHHFLEWARIQAVRGNPLVRRPPSAGDFLPRALYGEYLHSILDESAKIGVRAGTRLTVLCAEAIDTIHNDCRAWVTLADGRRLVADHVVLAIGHLPSPYPVPRPLAAYRTLRYIHFPWEPDRVPAIPKQDRIILAGSGLTAADIALSLYARGHSGEIIMISRRGLLPQVHRSGLAATGQLHFDSTALRKILRTVRREIAIRGEWRPILDALRLQAADLWQSLSSADRARFLRHVRPYWEIHRHRLAGEIAERLASLRSKKQLSIVAGRIADIQPLPDGLDVTYVPRGTAEKRRIQAGWMINCISPRSDFSKFRHPLLINLLASGTITHDPLALGAKATPDGRLISCGGVIQEWFHTLGPLMKGVLWESAAIPEIRSAAAAIAGRIAADRSR